MRNPMMAGVFLVLLGEALFFGSVPLGVWFLFFSGLCLVLIPAWEEPDLEKRFGEPYREYKGQVPRWIPKTLSDKKWTVSDEEEKYGLMDWFGSIIGIVVAGFILFILIWPLIDPTPEKSSSLKENIHKATGR